MGATNPYVLFKSRDGQTISLNLYYAGGDAAGYQVPASFSGVATANSNPTFTLPRAFGLSST